MTTILDEITSGTYDAVLEEIQKAAKARQISMRSSRTSGEYLVGDRVIFNDYCGTKYIRGHTAVIVNKKKTKVVVRLENPVGRFAAMSNGKVESKLITVPVSIIDKI
jgi:hypothetical protein